jgi:ABC-type polysaccharide transport system permease subunit
MLKRSRNILKNWQLYGMLVLPVAYLLVFCYYPMLGAQIAFRNYNIAQGIWRSPWVGFVTGTASSVIVRNPPRRTTAISLSAK